MTGLKILTVAFGYPILNDAQWLRIFTIARGLSKNNQLDFITFVKDKLSHSDVIKQKFDIDCTFVPFQGPDLVVKSIQLIKYYKPDLIFANTHLPAFMFGLNKIKTAPIVFDVHGLMFEERKMLFQKNSLFQCPKSTLSILVESFALKSSTMLSCVSHRMIDYFSSQGYKKTVYATNGVDLELFRPISDDHMVTLKNKLGLGGKFVFGYAGAFQRWQGVDSFVKAAKDTDDKDMAFVIIGGDNTFVDEKILTLKKMPRHLLPYYYAICDVLVLPRPYHLATDVAAPTKYSEYAAMGKPVLVTKVGDAGDFTKLYDCGIVVADNTVKNLKDGFLSFKKIKKNDLSRMGKNSRRLAESEFNWEKIIPQLDTAITALV